MTLQLWLAARSCLGDFPLARVLMEAAATAMAGVINHLPSCRSCTSQPCSCAGSVTSRINGYWWTCWAASSQLAAIPGDAQPPCAGTEAPTQHTAGLGWDRELSMGLGQLWVQVCALSPDWWLQYPALVQRLRFQKCFSCFIKLLALDRSCSRSVIHVLRVPLETQAGDNHILFILLIINY